jgi:hypothetical protein
MVTTWGAACILSSCRQKSLAVSIVAPVAEGYNFFVFNHYVTFYRAEIAVYRLAKVACRRAASITAAATTIKGQALASIMFRHSSRNLTFATKLAARVALSPPPLA